MTRRGGVGLFSDGEAEVEERVVRGDAGLDASFGFVDLNTASPCLAGGEDCGEKPLEFLASDRVLVNFKRPPVRWRSQNGEGGLRLPLPLGRFVRREKRRQVGDPRQTEDDQQGDHEL